MQLNWIFRAPELLFVMPEHSTAVDMWAVGCIFAEMILRRELFPGRSVGSQIKIVLHNLGTPSKEVKKIFNVFYISVKMVREVRCEKTRQYIHSFGEQNPLSWSDIIRLRDRVYNEDVLDLIAKLIRMEASERIDVHEALHHSFLQPYVPVIPVERGCPFKVVVLNFYL